VFEKDKVYRQIKNTQRDRQTDSTHYCWQYISVQRVLISTNSTRWVLHSV